MKKLLLLGLLAVPVFAQVGARKSCIYATPAESEVLAGVSTRLLARDDARACLVVQNKGASDAYIAFASGMGATGGLKLKSEEEFIFVPAPINEVWARAAAGVTTTVIAIPGK